MAMETEPSTMDERAAASTTPDRDIDKAPNGKPEVEENQYLTGLALLFALIGVGVSVLLTGLDQTVVANALPTIASVFHSLNGLNWVPTAFLITQVSCLPLFGQLPVVFPIKWIFPLTVLIFEIGSLLSALSPNFGFLIFARAFQGVGAGGIFVSTLVMVAAVAPLSDRPKYLGAVGALFAIGTVIGPIVGGALVQDVTWRWCFYLNLPLSIPTFLTSLIIILHPSIKNNKHLQATTQSSTGSYRDVFKIDWMGFILILAFTTCLVLGLQWGGNTKPWNSGDVIATLTLSGVLILIFGAWQRYRGEKALVPLILLQSRTIIGCCLVGLFSRMGFFAALYYLPIYFQAVHNRSVIGSGVDLLPLSICLILSAGISGGVIAKLGRYWHVMMFGPLLAVLAFGLLFTLDEHTSAGKYIGYQILAGVGIGSTTQVIILAAQADVKKEHVAQVSALVTFIQWLGAIIGLAVAGSVFQNKLVTGLHKFAPDAPIDQLRQSVSALSSLPPDQHAAAVHAYVKALDLVFVAVALPSSALCSLCTLLVKDRRLSGGKAGDADAKQSVVEGKKEDHNNEKSV